MSAYSEHKAKLKHQGYQEALEDIARAFEDGGIEKVGTWLKDNGYTFIQPTPGHNELIGRVSAALIALGKEES